ncbi:MAG: single-stranded-DNA-specific exonuclease RecJ [Thermoanaerobaculia bacterium]
MTRWTSRKTDPDACAALARGAGVSSVSASLLLARGVFDAPGASQFFAPGLSQGHDPFRMKGMERAVDVLVSAAREREKIVVFGDYDVDGVTAVAQLRAVLGALGANSVPFLPHRVRDGYGLRPETFRRVFEQHRPKAIVTVDCGITAVAAVAEATAAGVDVVITDHHLPADVLPDGASIVNPKQPGCGYPFKDLCGAGVAFKIAQGIIRRERLSLSERSLAKVAALGTISDIVPLLGENRGIVAEGLAGLGDPRAPGLRALLEEAGLSGRPPRAEDVAFRVAPRLNAAGRLDTADLALAVFEEKDPMAAAEIARELTSRNVERQQHERRVVSESRARILERGDPASRAVLIEADRTWPRGVLGIAASRLAREFHRPAFLFALDDSNAVGSGRSVPGVSIHAILSEIRSRFVEFGGHAQACGGTIRAGDFEAFRESAEELFRLRVPEEHRSAELLIDGELSFSQIREEFLGELERFEPFGEANAQPVFLTRRVSSRSGLRRVGERGCRGILAAGGREIRAIAWNLSDRWESLAAAEMDVAYHVRRNARYGNLEIEIVDVREPAP